MRLYCLLAGCLLGPVSATTRYIVREPDTRRVRARQETESTSTVSPAGEHSLPRVAVRAASGLLERQPMIPMQINASALTSRIAALAIAQLNTDAANAISVPLLEYDQEYFVTETGELFVARPSRLIARRAFATVFELADSEFVIKYQTGSDLKDGLHVLLRDYWFLKDLESSGWVPKVHFVSPAVALPLHVTGKTDFLMSDFERTFLVNQRNATVRYMVMQKARTTMQDCVSGRAGQPVPVSFALNAMIQTVFGLRFMHDKGIVHGDVHPGNIVVLDDGATGFIDFGSAFFIEEMDGTPDRIAEPMSHLHCYYSPYDIQGFRFSYRDDVFKAIWLGAFLMSGTGLDQFCSHLVAHGMGEELYDFKSQGYMFQYPGGPDSVDLLANVTTAAKAEIKLRLGIVLHLVRNVGHINQRPDYDGIIAELEAALALVPEHQ